MAFNITEFTSELTTRGTVRSEHFEMSFSGDIFEKIGPYYNSISQRSALDILKGLTLRVEATTLPQRAISPLQYLDYGVPYKMGGLANYVEIDSTIILSADMGERHFFMAWQDLITGQHRTNKDTVENRGNQFDIGYFDNYKCDSITITQFGNPTKTGYEIKLYDAFPLNVGPVTVSWATTEILKQNVTFTYRYFKERQLDGSNMN